VDDDDIDVASAARVEGLAGPDRDVADLNPRRVAERGKEDGEESRVPRARRRCHQNVLSVESDVRDHDADCHEDERGGREDGEEAPGRAEVHAPRGTGRA